MIAAILEREPAPLKAAPAVGAGGEAVAGEGPGPAVPDGARSESGAGVGHGACSGAYRGRPGLALRIAVAAAAVLAVALITVSWIAWRATRPVEYPLTRLNVDLGPDAVVGVNTTVAISPDGRRIVYPARGPDGKQQLATRLLDQAQPALLPGTEGGADAFFSPDGQWIGFFSSGQMKKIPVQGGAPVVLATLANVGYGASWGDGEDLIAAMGAVGPLFRISPSGGAPEPFAKLDARDRSQRWPQILQGGARGSLLGFAEFRFLG